MFLNVLLVEMFRRFELSYKKLRRVDQSVVLTINNAVSCAIFMKIDSQKILI